MTYLGIKILIVCVYVDFFYTYLGVEIKTNRKLTPYFLLDMKKEF